MNDTTNLFASMTWQQTWELIGWTMCYFLAIGTVVALTGSMIRFACRLASPQIRYTVSFAVFATLAILPIGIAINLLPSLPATTASVAPVAVMESMLQAPQVIDLKDQPLTDTLPPRTTPLPAAVAQVAATSESISANVTIGSAIKLLPWVWIVGAPLTFVLLATGLIGSERFRRQSEQLAEGPVFEACQRLRGSLQISRHVGIAVCERIASPLLVGVVRPLILLPPAALTGWTPEELEMVLLHELAHVRRWDNLVNFAQRVVESLLFFHPCVWWVSRWVRTDREECCDAVVVSQTAKPQAYAELLVALATPHSPLAGLAMAQHPLAGRIRRILHLEEEKMLVSRNTITLAGTALAGLLIALLWAPVGLTGAEEVQSVTIEKKNGTAEDAESAEEEIEKQQLYTKTFPDASGSDGGNEFADFLKSKGKQVHVTKNADGTVTIRGRNNPGPTPVQPPPAVFLSLEDQKKADLAYKLLGLELESVNEEELARVQAMKFAGGLKVIRPKSSLGDGVESGDLLVGLHVWPIRSLVDVQKILSRDDLAELSPLKFYVIRKVPNPEHAGYGPSPAVDKLVTGRINVNLDANPSNRLRTYLNSSKATPLSPHILAAGDLVKVVVDGTSPDQPIHDVYPVESMGTIALGPTYGRVQVVGLTLQEAEDKVKVKLKQILKEVNVMITLAKKSKNTLDLYPGVPQPIDRYPGSPQPMYFPAASRPPQPTVANNPYTPVPASAPLGNRAKPTLMFFHGPTSSAPSKAMKSIVRQITKQMSGQIDVVLVDVNQASGLASNYQVTKVPTLLLFQYGKKIGTYQGGPNVEELKSFINSKVIRPPVPTGPPRYNVPPPGDWRQVGPVPQGVAPHVPPSATRSAEIKEAIQRIKTARVELKYARAQHEVALKSYEAKLEKNRQNKVQGEDVATQKSRVESEVAKLKVERAKALLNDLEKEKTALEKPPTATILYDNKTFEQWRGQWKNELKTEKRTEAIAAMAAFGRAGRGKEAVEAILDVAGEYDFLHISDDSAGKLKEKVLATLNSYGSLHLPPKLWLPELLGRYQEEPEKWKWLVSHAISRLGRAKIEPYAKQRLLELARGDEEFLTSAALNALNFSDADDPQVRELVEESVTNKKAKLLLSHGLLLARFKQFGGGGYGRSGPAQVRSMPALLTVLRHSDMEVRRIARESCQYLPDEDVPQIVAAMSKDLQAAKSDEQRLMAIRALAALGPRAAKAGQLLTKYQDKQHSKSVRLASLYACLCIEQHDPKERAAYISAFVSEEFPASKMKLAEEAKQIFPEQPKNGGGGGGGRGGGGGFF